MISAAAQNLPKNFGACPDGHRSLLTNFNTAMLMIRYITFAISLIFVSVLFLAHIGNIERIMFWAFIIGNAIYYIVGIILAFVFKDNRAFCKYICPITIFLKPMSYFSLLRIKCDKSKCVSCGKCKNVCPMEVDVTDNSRKRKNGTECILCFECVKNCPRDAL